MPASRSGLDEEAVELPHVDARIVTDGRANERHSFVRREQRLLGSVRCDGDHDPVDEGEASFDQVFVAARDGIEAAGVDGGPHRE